MELSKNIGSLGASAGLLQLGFFLFTSFKIT